MTYNSKLCIVALLFVCACAPRAIVRTGYNFSQIKKVAVLPFDGDTVGSAIVADEYITQLLRAGVEVIDKQQSKALATAQLEKFNAVAQNLGIDAYFTGTVSQYQSDQKFLIMMGDGEHLVQQPVIQLQGSSYYYKDKKTGSDENEYLLSVGAVASVNARLVDVRSGMVVWTNSATYEALNSEHAVAQIVDYFIRSLEPYWPLVKLK